MSSALKFDFEHRFASGLSIIAGWQQPIEGFSVTILYGPSGCGKTTVLRRLAGLEIPVRGEVVVSDQHWFHAEKKKHLGPQQRGVGMMFQDYALFPHLSVEQNVAYGVAEKNPQERRRQIDHILEDFQLTDLCRRYPHQISGGQQQRTALARAVAMKPKLLLLDEPLSALDSRLRDAMRESLRKTLASYAIPTIMVTHDLREARAIGDRIAVMIDGRVRQFGTLNEVRERPVDDDVARLMESPNARRGDRDPHDAK